MRKTFDQDIYCMAYAGFGLNLYPYCLVFVVVVVVNFVVVVYFHHLEAFIKHSIIKTLGAHRQKNVRGNWILLTKKSTKHTVQNFLKQ